MHRLLWSSVVSLLVVSTLPAQTRTIVERLGYPANAMNSKSETGLTMMTKVGELPALPAT